VTAIATELVAISVREWVIEIPDDTVSVSAGGILPTMFPQKIGIKVEKKWGSEQNTLRVCVAFSQ